MDGPCRIACAITILPSRVVEIRGFPVYDRTGALEGVIVRESSIGPRCRYILISKSHIVLRLTPELCQSPGCLPLSDLEALGHLLIEPGEELHVTSTVTEVGAFKSLDLDFVLNALHLLNDRRSDRITVVR
jgi:hypothetical protein